MHHLISPYKGIQMYKSEFESAVKRTEMFGLSCPEVNYAEGTILTQEKMMRFPQTLEQYIGRPGVEEVVAQCLSIHYKLKEPLSEIFGAPCTFTIGYVETPSRLMFHQSEDALRGILQNGVEGNTLNIHAWLTLPTMEIIDMSLPTSYAVINNEDEGIGGVIAQHPDELTGGMKYHPMLVGEDFLRQCGGLIEF